MCGYAALMNNQQYVHGYISPSMSHHISTAPNVGTTLPQRYSDSGNKKRVGVSTDSDNYSLSKDFFLNSSLYYSVETLQNIFT